MKLFSNDLILKKKNIVSNLPDGADCLAAAELCDHFSKILIILRDDVRLSRFSQSLSIITNNIDIIEFPAWDCLPFDKNSPNQKLVGKRVRALSSLANPNSKKTIILSTIGSVIQKIPNQDFIKNSSKSIQSGQNIWDWLEVQYEYQYSIMHREENHLRWETYNIQNELIDSFVVE